MIVTLKSYLARLEEQEAAKPEDQRKEVPQIKDLAKEIDIHVTRLSKIANNRAALLSLDIMTRIIRALRRRGFNTDVSDLLKYVEGGEE